MLWPDSASPRKLEKLLRIDKVDFALGLITLLLVLALDPASRNDRWHCPVDNLHHLPHQLPLVEPCWGRLPETGDFEVIAWQYGQRSGTTDSEAQAVPGVIVYRFGSPLIFANAEAFKEDW